MDSRYRQLTYDGLKNRYLSFDHISPDQFESLNRQRYDLLGKGAAFTYLTNIETLIIKLPTEATESAHLSLSQRIMIKTVMEMQIEFNEFRDLGAMAYKGVNSFKEGDSSFRNFRVRHNKGDWPNFVIEAGFTETLPLLRSEARWWIENSAGKVSIVLLISLQPRIKTLKIEK